MFKLVTIEEAARATDFPPEEIAYWVKSKKIKSVLVKDRGRLVDLDNLRDFISHIECLGIHKLYLQLIVKEKKEEADEIIAQLDDYIFQLKSLKKISPLLKRIVAELSIFIHNKRDKVIFTEITAGTRILDIAKRFCLSYDNVCHRYKDIVEQLEKETGFLADYRKTIVYQEQEIDRLRFQNRNLEHELRTLFEKALRSGLRLEPPQSLTEIPSDAAKRICKPITNLTLSPYIRKCLSTLEIETIEDLLRYMRKKGLNSLLETPGFGELGLEQLKFQLEKHKIMNRNGHSELFQYIIDDPVL